MQISTPETAVNSNIIANPKIAYVVNLHTLPLKNYGSTITLIESFFICMRIASSTWSTGNEWVMMGSRSINPLLIIATSTSVGVRVDHGADNGELLLVDVLQVQPVCSAFGTLKISRWFLALPP